MLGDSTPWFWRRYLEPRDESDEGGGEAVVFQGLKQGPVRDTVEDLVEIYVEAV